MFSVACITLCTSRCPPEFHAKAYEETVSLSHLEARLGSRFRNIMLDLVSFCIKLRSYLNLSSGSLLGMAVLEISVKVYINRVRFRVT